MIFHFIEKKILYLLSQNILLSSIFLTCFQNEQIILPNTKEFSDDIKKKKAIDADVTLT